VSRGEPLGGGRQTPVTYVAPPDASKSDDTDEEDGPMKRNTLILIVANIAALAGIVAQVV